MESVVIKIDKLGKPQVGAEGFMDGGCKTATAPFIAGLSDGQEIDNVDKAEASIPAAADNSTVGAW